MTIHKSQGQSPQKGGISLPQPVFSHEMLIVAFSRTTSFIPFRTMSSVWDMYRVRLADVSPASGLRPVAGYKNAAKRQGDVQCSGDSTLS
ncbi:hypothetical protein TNCV_4004541 [Trichonephila clavipes]|nr:hypothetical protein TNCV_4004541 [Trichonephila clavipes]